MSDASWWLVFAAGCWLRLIVIVIIVIVVIVIVIIVIITVIIIIIITLSSSWWARYVQDRSWLRLDHKNKAVADNTTPITAKAHLDASLKLLLHSLLGFLLLGDVASQPPFQSNWLALLIGKVHSNLVEHVLDVGAAALACQHGEDALQVAPHLPSHLPCYGCILLSLLCCALNDQIEFESEFEVSEMSQQTGADVMLGGGNHEQGHMIRHVVHIGTSYVSAWHLAHDA